MEAFSQFASDLDASTQQLLNRGRRLTELLKQPQYKPMPVEEQVVSIYAGVRGYLDKISVDDVSRFEQGLLREMHGKGKPILDTLRADRQIKPETEEKLKKFMEDYTKAFV